MNNTRQLLLAGAVCALAGIFTACKSPTVVDSSYGNAQFQVQCMGTDLDGSITVRSWGTASTRGQAIEQAKKNAVKAVLFDGITKGVSGCNQRPVVNTVNAWERYEDFFNRFFADGGQYKKFVSLKDEKATSRVKSANKEMENWGIVVRVNRAGLREYMREEGIIQ